MKVMQQELDEGGWCQITAVVSPSLQPADGIPLPAGEVLSAAQQVSSLGLQPPNSPHIEVMLYLDQTDTPVKSKTLTSQNYAPLMR